ncbi:MAG: hypothetical protein J6S42_05925 [Thermoguttaceae bacterium]|nr:hypothetical protein [Thermoguttaceae bacterium]
MACFVVPAVEAVVVSAVDKCTRKKEAPKAASQDAVAESTAVVPFRRKIKWLTRMLWGGCILLAFEHLWHGEIVPWFPFLTAMSSPEDTAEMLREMATVGVTMAALITVVWFVMCKVADAIAKRPAPDDLQQFAG